MEKGCKNSQRKTAYGWIVLRVLSRERSWLLTIICKHQTNNLIIAIKKHLDQFDEITI